MEILEKSAQEENFIDVENPDKENEKANVEDDDLESLAQFFNSCR